MDHARFGWIIDPDQCSLRRVHLGCGEPPRLHVLLGDGSLHHIHGLGLELHPLALALAAGVFVAFMVLVSGFIPLALAAGVFIAFTVLASALSAGNLQAIQASLFEPKQRRPGTVFLQQTDLVYLHS